MNSNDNAINERMPSKVHFTWHFVMKKLIYNY